MTYEEIAERYSVKLCPGCKDWTVSQHREGTSGLVLMKVHWAPRRVTKRGLYRFLKLLAQVRLGSRYTTEVWRIWVEATEAITLGLELGVRFPREFADTDRARVRALLAKKPFLDKETRERITRWARD